MTRPRRLAALLAGGVAVGGCGHPPARTAPPPVEAVRRCRGAADSTAPSGHILLVVEHADEAARAAEAASLEPPMRLDCDGLPVPALASAWSRDTSARWWTLVLSPRPGDDSLLWTAPNLAAAWRASPAAQAALRYARAASVLPLDDRRLVIGFAAPHSEIPTVLADRALAVPTAERPAPTFEARATGGDLRDAIDAGADAVTTDDPSLLDYAARRGGLAAVALPWSRAYLLLVPPGSRGLTVTIPTDTAGFRAELARDAVHADARPAGAAWWDSTDACPRDPASRSAPSAGRGAPELVYPRADRVARELAERLVALAADPALRARGAEPAAFEAAVRGGAERAYLVRVDLHPTVPCREADRWRAGSQVVALVETRTHLIVRRGTPALEIEWDGTVRPERP